MRNKRVISMIEKLLSEQKVMSAEEIHEKMLGKNFCPTKQHLGVILSSLPSVTSDASYKSENGVPRNLWRLKDETPTDN